MATYASLADIPMRSANRLQHVALSRLLLYLLGRIHANLLPLQEWLIGAVRATAGPDGNVDPARLMGITAQLEPRWSAALTAVRQVILAGRYEAAGIPFGVLAVQHNAMMEGVGRAVEESLTYEQIAQMARLWAARRERALTAAAQRVYADGLTFSQRIWRLENSGLTQIRSTLATGMSGRTSAWDLARELEGQLGAEADMPRWTRARLYRMTPDERAIDRSGLLRGPENRGRGVAYNALRLARTELQYANHAVSTEIAAHNPAVTGRKVRLSPGHPQIDICDEYAAGGQYDKTEQILPLHPNCMCYYEDVLMDRQRFVGDVRGWVRGENGFLDDYASWLANQDAEEPWPWDGLSIAETMLQWLGENADGQAAAIDLALSTVQQ